MHAADLLAELARSLGLAPLHLSAMDTATLVVDGDLALNFEVDIDGDRLWAYVALGEPPAMDRERLYARLLEANLFGHDSGGGTVALDSARNEVLVCRGFDLEHTDAQDLEPALADLIDAARRLRALWSTAPAPAAALPGTTLPQHLAALMRA